MRRVRLRAAGDVLVSGTYEEGWGGGSRWRVSREGRRIKLLLGVKSRVAGG